MSRVRWNMEGFEKTSARKARKHIDFRDQKKRGYYEDDPAFEEMKRFVGHSRTPSVDGHANHADPEAVHQNGDGNTGQQHQSALPERRAKQICRQKTQAEEGKQVAQSTAGVDDLQLVGTEIDHVAVEIDGDLKRSDEEGS